MDRQINIYSDDKIRIFKLKQSLTKIYISGIDNMYFNKKIRFVLSYLCGGSIYYMVNGDDKDIMGYCMVSKGKSFHYRYAETDSITVGPIYLKSSYRGKRLSVFLLETILEHYKEQGCSKAYAYIHKINKQSNALFSRVGFVPINNLKIARWTRQVSITAKPDTDYRLYRRELWYAELKKDD